MRNIAIFTTTRAEFGILSPLINEIEKDGELEYCLFVGGTHLAHEHGKTIQEIEKFNYRVTSKFDYLLNEDTNISLAKSVGIATYELAIIFNSFNFDFVCIVGDRFELLSIVTNAILFKKPIIHLYGGEKSEGVIDEQIRHMITKAAHLHFVACEEYALNILQLDEPKWRVFNSGSLAIDNIVHNEKIPKKQLFQMLNLDENKPTVLMTYHPVTLEFALSQIQQIKNIFFAIKKYDFQLVITSPNIEVDREQIVSHIKQEISKNNNYHYFESLGVIQYHSLISHCKFVIGNSSSGIVEIPYFKVPTVNIGDRQKGRVRHESIVDTDYTVESITRGVEKALSKDFLKSLQSMVFKFGDGTAVKKIVEVIKTIKINQKLLRK